MQQVLHIIPPGFGTEPFFCIDAKGEVLTCNNAAADIIEGVTGAVSGKKFSSFFTEPFTAEKMLQQITATGSVSNLPLFLKSHGKPIPVTLNAFSITDQFGEPNIFVVASIQQQPGTLKAQSGEQQLLFASIVDSSEDAILSKTLDGEITGWNPGAQKIFQFSAAEIIGHSISILIPPHLQEEEKKILQKISRGQTIRHYETERVRRDGTIINVSLTISPIKDATGKVVGASKIARDITDKKKAEEDYQKSLKQISDYRYALDESSIVAITDQRGIITSVNDNFCKISGYSRSELIGQDHRIINSGHHAKTFIRDLWVTIANGKIWRGELMNRAKDGSIYWVDTTIVPFLNEQGKPYQYVAIRADITKRKQAEQELEQSNSLLEKAEAQAGLGSWQIDVNTGKGKWSKQMFRFFGLPTGSEAPAFEDYLQWVHPEDRAYLQEVMLDSKAGRAPVSKVYRTNPDLLPLRYLLPSWQLVNDRQGRQWMFEGTLLDITDLKLAEQKNKASEEIYKTIASSIPDSVICILDRDYRYLLIEGDMLEKLGYSKANLLGQKAKDALGAKTFAEAEIDFKRAFNGEIVGRESRRLGYDVISRFIPLKDEQQQVYAIMTVTIDITRLKTAQRSIIEMNHSLEQKISERTEELKKSNDELEAFSYSVSHDLRAPLRAVSGYAGMLEEDYDKVLDDEAKRLLGEIRNNAKRMGMLIDDLLNFSRLGRKEVERSLIDMNKLTDSAIREIEQATTHHAQISYRNLIPIKGDYMLMQNVMINLISNAIKYSSKKESPLITISAETDNGEVIFCITDNGVGFDMEYIHKLFGVFQRLHGNDEFPGTGVGLAIVQRIIQKHKGRVWALGKPGEGASFYFALPQQTN